MGEGGGGPNKTMGNTFISTSHEVLTIGVPVSCCMLKRCPISCAMVLETAGSEPKSSIKPTEKAPHNASTYANPTMLPSRLVPLHGR